MYIERAVSQQPKVPHPLIPHKFCEWHLRCLKLCHYLKITRQSEVRYPPRKFSSADPGSNVFMINSCTIFTPTKYVVCTVAFCKVPYLWLIS